MNTVIIEPTDFIEHFLCNSYSGISDTVTVDKGAHLFEPKCYKYM